MRLIADLHIHSRYSRATSKNLDFIALHRGALQKGIGLVGTGDFTHPGWREEIESQLIPAEEGLFKLRPDLAREASQGLPEACAGEVRFVLQVEISNIYKKEDRTRKNHNLVFVPSLDAATRFTDKLKAIGNVASDGRPILGLDARDLLEMTLESDPLAFLVPAHIWTPWFSLFGSKSGFDHIEECFGDLTSHIFAIETGLSSDPSMNWRIPELDGMTIISNSDAHSAAKLGREANLLDIDLGYEPLLDALKGGPGFLGTIEFFPEEGKYHMDGHRKCDLRLSPEETRELGGRCPTCGGKLTVGVMSRVMDLADPARPEGFTPRDRPPFECLVPLAEVVSEVLGVGPGSKKVGAFVDRVLARLGPELHVLKDAPLEEIESAGGPPLKEAVRRVRCGEMHIAAGYDGEFGVVKVFDEKERDRLLGQTDFTALPGFGAKVKAPKKTPETSTDEIPPVPFVKGGEGDQTGPEQESEDNHSPLKRGLRGFRQNQASDLPPDDPRFGLNPAQRQVVETADGPLLVVAGPGTGKTRTLVSRIAHQIREGRVRPDRVLAVTFTHQATDELAERLAASLDLAEQDAPLVTTFHGLGTYILNRFGVMADLRLIDDDERFAVGETVLGQDAKKRDVEALLGRISLAKQGPAPEAAFVDDAESRAHFEAYEAALAQAGQLDIDDLVLKAFRYLDAHPEAADAVAGQFQSISIDEYQDINNVQAALVRLLSPDGRKLLVIGDPDQAIYGFRGAEPGHFNRFNEVFQKARAVSLTTTYRLTQPVLAAAQSVIEVSAPLEAVQDGPRVEVVACPTAESEAEQILVRIERIIGGTSSFAVNSGRGSDAELHDVGFGDMAVLTRLKTLHGPIRKALERSGVPCRQVAEDEPHDPRSDKVALMTLHAAKGREFEVVFIAGVEPSLVPLSLPGLTSDPNEERRLLYVAMTRAKRLAVISHAANRMLFGQHLEGGPSPAIARLPRDAVIHTAPELPKKQRDTQLSLF